ncbi:MAG: phage baseplate assembly protein [Pseudomonadota bacterium]
MIREMLFNMLGRGAISGWTDGPRPRAQVSGLADEVLDDRDAFQDYGFASHPLAGAAAFFGCLFGRRSKAIVLRTPDRRYRVTLQPGEVAVHDDQGQVVHLTRDGILIQTAKTVTVQAGPLLRLEGDHVQIHARQKLSFDINGYGWHIRHVDGSTWENLTWQVGAVMAPVDPLPINPPEGP